MISLSAPNIYFQHSHPLATKFEDRFAALPDQTHNLLKSCAALTEFLSRAISFLSISGNERHTEQVAHYLMGTVNYLPEELDAAGVDISANVKSALSELLRTHRYGMFGTVEAPEKTIAKLNALKDHLLVSSPDQFVVIKSQQELGRHLQKWVDAAISDERACRVRAQQAIMDCVRTGEKKLSLCELGLTTIPPLPSDLKSLDLAGNKLTSLVGLPWRMNALTTLYLARNQLTRLAGLPSEMNALTTLSVARNQLTSLAGLPSEMNALTLLYLLENQLTSLSGLPRAMNALKELSVSGNRLTSLAGMPSEMNSLEKLDLEGNQLTSLVGMLPRMDALRTLVLEDNQLTSLVGMPSQMNALRSLALYGNQLQSLVGMPYEMNSLRTLCLRNNRLVSLDGLPQAALDNRNSLILLARNPLSSEAIAELDSRRLRGNVLYDSDGQRCPPLDEVLKQWFGGMDTSSWMDYVETRGGRALALLLTRLRESATFKGADKDAAVNDLKAILERMRTDATFQEYCFEAVLGSDADCVDNVQAIFDDLRMQFANPALKEGVDLDEVVKFYKGRLAATLIDEYVTRLKNGGDLLESGMFLKHELSHKFNLPIRFVKPIYAQVAVVKDNIDFHKIEAGTYIKKKLTEERLAKEMSSDLACSKLLQKFYPATFVAGRLIWVDALEQAFNFNPSKASGVHESRLSIAKNMQVGDGKRFGELREEAHKDLLTQVTRHALDNPVMTPQARVQWEMERLLKDKDWQDYLKNIRSGSGSSASNAWNEYDETKQALKAEGLNLDH